MDVSKLLALICILLSAIVIGGSVRNLSLGDSSRISPQICISPWKYHDGHSCKCGKIPHDLLCCDDSNSVKNVSVLTSYCMTYNNHTNVTEVGSCIYYPRSSMQSVYYGLPDKIDEVNHVMCGNGGFELHRAGTLCGKCMANYYPRVYSVDMDCIPCPDGPLNWWKYMLMVFLPLTAFSFAILFLKINISSNLHGFVFYSQVVSMPQITRGIILTLKHKPLIQKNMRIIGTLYGFWNLDFFRLLYPPVCLGTGTLQTLVLDLIVAIYPLLLMMLTYLFISLHDNNFKPLVVLCKPFRAAMKILGRNWEIKTTVIDSFATFILLSNVKFLSIAFDLLAPVSVYQLNSTGTNGSYTTHIRLYYDATLEYFGPTHLPYGMIGVITLVLFVLLPTVLLILYPFDWFQKLLNLFPGRWYILHTFMDSFQGCFKDGTELGTRDFRWFASVFFVLRLVAMLAGAFVQTSMFFPITCMLVVGAIVLLLVVQPFKVNHHTYITAMFLLLLAMWYVLIVNVRQPVLLYCACIVGILPLLYISALVLHWMYTHKKFGFQIIGTLRAWKQGYRSIHSGSMI